MTKIESEQIKTRSRVWFVMHDWAFWICWCISILFGSLALAASLFVFYSLTSKVYLLTHESLAAYLLSAWPYLWMFSFVGMCAVAYLNLRHTPQGYRYSSVWLIGLNLSLTLLLGIGLFLMGAGRAVEEQVGTKIPHYQSALAKQELRWFSPEQGLLVGEVVDVNATTKYFILQPPNAVKLNVDGRLLSADEWMFLDLPAVHVRVIGKPGVEQPFVACVVLPSLDVDDAVFDDEWHERIFNEPRSIECRGVEPYERFDQINQR